MRGRSEKLKKVRIKRGKANEIKNKSKKKEMKKMKKEMKIK